MEHEFTANIKSVIEKYFGRNANDIFEKSQLIQYINLKTRSANRGSKARSSFANIYAIYVLVEDYIEKGFDKKDGYPKSDGALYTNLFNRQRQLPFGSKLQNHAFNNRMNSEFQKYFKDSVYIPIIRNLDTNRYWINQNLLKIKIGRSKIDIGNVIIEIINEYIKTKEDSFLRFVKTCTELQDISKTTPKKVKEFIKGLLDPNVDARLFEIASYSILKYFYNDQQIIWGYEMDKLNTENLKLYKTGRTNANDGGIDFVMKPLGRFFQVTETLDFRKYFLDIDKIQKYPLTFVIKSTETTADLLTKIEENARKAYSIKSVVENYMQCIEEIINIPILNERFDESVKLNYLNNILNEIAIQSKLEFNLNDEDDDDDTTFAL